MANDDKYAARRQPRPHMWKVKGEIPHQQYKAYMVAKAQASFRKEQFELTFEQYQELWKDHWHNRGRTNDKMTLTRSNTLKPWCVENCIVITRLEHLSRQKQFKQNKRGQYELFE